MNKKINELTTEEKKTEMQNVKLIKKKRYESIKLNIDMENGEIQKYCSYDLKEAENEDLGTAFRLHRSLKDKQKRLNKRIADYIQGGGSLFITMTFNNFCLKKMNKETIERYIKKYLKNNCISYVANIDYGKKKNRLHYHAVVLPFPWGLDLEEYRCLFHRSNINIEHIRTNEKTSSVKLAHYINKLTFHALKDNGHCQRLIMSRHTPNYILLEDLKRKRNP